MKLRVIVAVAVMLTVAGSPCFGQESGGAPPKAGQTVRFCASGARSTGLVIAEGLFCEQACSEIPTEYQCTAQTLLAEGWKVAGSAYQEVVIEKEMCTCRLVGNEYILEKQTEK